MTGTWFTADTHFRHGRVAELRGFASREEHDAEVIARWNKTVGPEDQVWLLGDVGMGEPHEYLPLVGQLNGVIHLIAGNHDPVWPGHQKAHTHQRSWLQHFASVQAFARRRLNGRDVLLSHFPYSGDHTAETRYPDYRLRDMGKPLIHGHVHGEWKVNGRQVNVGLEMWDMRPVSIDVLAKLVGELDG